MFQLILNPVENLPFLFDIKIPVELKGLYVSDKLKTEKIVQNSKIGFSGRENINLEIRDIYQRWSNQLNVKHLSMRLLSGLHAHIILFMGLGKIGDTILLLPECAGGHYATKQILERLGYYVIEMIPDMENYCLDIVKTKELITQVKPNLIFIDRSEGLYYEDFTALLSDVPSSCGTIFDASQYLTNILEKDFVSPFDMGFDIMMSTLHKNFPGPQKALVCSKDDNPYWERIENSMSNYVSNLHAENIILAGEIIKKEKILKKYSSLLLYNSKLLERNLLKLQLPVVARIEEKQQTHHLWLTFPNNEKAYHFYKKLELCGLLVNYRKLPYNLGMGIRMGTSASTLQGINPDNIQELSSLIAEIFYIEDVDSTLIDKVQNFLGGLIPLTCAE
mgnify:CR=1 FL=1|jgi:Glycine/serine hydroxymethyltransferase